MDPLSKFGDFLIKATYDKVLLRLDMLVLGELRTPLVKDLQNKVSAMSVEDKKTLRSVVEDLLANALHDLLFAIQVSHDMNSGVEVIVDGRNVVELSDGLNAEIFGSDGWIERFGEYKSRL